MRNYDMPTSFSLTFDSLYGSLVLVTAETIIDDVTDIRITKTDSGYDCEVVRAENGTPVRLVAAASPAGRHALERANGKLSSVPGFVEVTAPTSTTVFSLADDIAEYLGRERRAADSQGRPSG
jgi:hypothetical protein